MWSEGMPIVADTAILEVAMGVVRGMVVAAGMGEVDMAAMQGMEGPAVTVNTSRRRNPKTRPMITGTVWAPMAITRTTNPPSINTKTPKTIKPPLPPQTPSRKKNNLRSKQIPGNPSRK